MDLHCLRISREPKYRMYMIVIGVMYFTRHSRDLRGNYMSVVNHGLILLGVLSTVSLLPIVQDSQMVHGL